jgi:hypothetical protein
VLAPARPPPSRERAARGVRTASELLKREHEIMRSKQEHLHDEACRLDDVIAEMEREIDAYTVRVATLPSARFKKGGNRLDRATLLLSPALAEAEESKMSKKLDGAQDRLQLLSRKHNEMSAENRKLRLRVEDARRVKMHQHSSMQIANSVADRAGMSVSSMITQAQRAYAEQEIFDARIGEVRAAMGDAAEEHAAALRQIAADEAELEAVEADRERELAQLDDSVQVTLQKAQAEDERRASEHADYKAIVDRRAKYQDGLEQIISDLEGKNIADLVSTYTTTASKILSLWDKHAEQEAELQHLDKHLHALGAELGGFEEQRRELAAANHGGETRPARLATSLPPRAAALKAGPAGGAPKGPPGDGGGGGGGGGGQLLANSAYLLTERLHAKEMLCKHACALVQELAAAIPQAWQALSADASDESQLECGQHNFGAFFAAIEDVATGRVLALRKEAARAAETADAAALVEQAELAGALADASASKLSADSSAESAGAAGKRRAVRGALAIAPPTMEGIITRERVDEVAVFTGYGEERFGRKSLRSELLVQIKAGVTEQREKIREEAILVAIGERKAESASRPEIDWVGRERSIETWLRRHHKGDEPGGQRGALRRPARPGSAKGARPGSAARRAGAPQRHSQPTSPSDGATGGRAAAPFPPNPETLNSMTLGAREAAPRAARARARARAHARRRYAAPTLTGRPIVCLPCLVARAVSRGGTSSVPALRDGPRRARPIDPSNVVERLHLSRSADALAADGGSPVAAGLLPRAPRALAARPSSSSLGFDEFDALRASSPLAIDHDIAQLNSRLLKLAQQREYLKMIRVRPHAHHLPGRRAVDARLTRALRPRDRCRTPLARASPRARRTRTDRSRCGSGSRRTTAHRAWASRSPNTDGWASKCSRCEPRLKRRRPRWVRATLPS